MPPIDYSKWDNIDTDSEPEPEVSQPRANPPRAPAANAAPPATQSTSRSAATQTTSESTATQTTSQPTAAPSAPSEPIQAVIVRCDGDRNRQNPPWQATTIPADHPVFSNPVPDIPRLIELPLVIHRVGTVSPDRAALGNQIATYLNIDAESGFAPMQWQSHVGTVIVARQDRKPLLVHHLEGVWMFCDHILDLFGYGDGPPRRLYNRAAFERWWKGYCEEQKEFRTGNAGERDMDDWRSVRSPFEM